MAIRGGRVHDQVEVGVAAGPPDRGEDADQDGGQVVDLLVGQIPERALVKRGDHPRLERGAGGEGLEGDKAALLLDHSDVGRALRGDEVVVHAAAVLVVVAGCHVDPTEEPGEEHRRCHDLRMGVRERRAGKRPEVLEHHYRLDVLLDDELAVPGPPHVDDASNVLLGHLVHPAVMPARLDHDLMTSDARHLPEERRTGASHWAVTGKGTIEVGDDPNLPVTLLRISEDLRRSLILVAGAERAGGIELGQLRAGNYDRLVWPAGTHGRHHRPLPACRILPQRRHPPSNATGTSLRLKEPSTPACCGWGPDALD